MSISNLANKNNYTVCCKCFTCVNNGMEFGNDQGTTVIDFNNAGCTMDFEHCTVLNLNVPPGSDSLANLSDVNLSSPQDDQVLQYDSGTSKWVNATFPLTWRKKDTNTTPSNADIAYRSGSVVVGDSIPVNVGINSLIVGKTLSGQTYGDNCIVFGGDNTCNISADSSGPNIVSGRTNSIVGNASWNIVSGNSNLTGSLLATDNFLTGSIIAGDANEFQHTGSSCLVVGQGNIFSGTGIETPNNGCTMLGTSNSIDPGCDDTLCLGTGNNSMATESKCLATGGSGRAFREVILGSFCETLGIEHPTTWVATDPILKIGIGQDNGSRQNALVMLKNGATTFSTLSGTGSRIVESNANGLISASKVILNGNYVPTISALSNLGSVGALSCNYVRVDKNIQVYFIFTVTPTNLATTFGFTISLPIATSFASSSAGIGLCNGPAQNISGTGQINAGPNMDFVGTMLGTGVATSITGSIMYVIP